MYHYVRRLAGSRFPALKALTVDELDQQLDHIGRQQAVVGAADLVAAVRGERELPGDACVLTFDDGLRDHHAEVLPRLARRGWPACFFPAAQPVLRRTVLDVHKLHFVLASSPDAVALTRRVEEELERLRRAQPELPTWAELRQRHAGRSRFDDPEVALIKRVLQHALPLGARQAIVDALFRELVTTDEAAFSEELYMGLAELRELVDAGMAVGGHGDAHERLGLLPAPEQGREVAATVRLLELVGGQPAADWPIAYPHGSYNAETLRLVRAAGAAVGFTIEPAPIESLARPLELPRLDTNDLPPRTPALALAASEAGEQLAALRASPLRDSAGRAPRCTLFAAPGEDALGGAGPVEGVELGWDLRGAAEGGGSLERALCEAVWAGVAPPVIAAVGAAPAGGADWPWWLPLHRAEEPQAAAARALPSRDVLALAAEAGWRVVTSADAAALADAAADPAPLLVSPA